MLQLAVRDDGTGAVCQGPRVRVRKAQSTKQRGRHAYERTSSSPTAAVDCTWALSCVAVEVNGTCRAGASMMKGIVWLCRLMEARNIRVLLSIKWRRSHPSFIVKNVKG